MKRSAIIFIAATLLTACTQQSLQQRTAELCRNIPSDALCEQSLDYLTDDFYDVLDTLFCLPELEALDHEWLHFFTAADGSAIADCACEVLSVTQSDDSHATATVRIQPADTGYDAEQHTLSIVREKGKWLLDDFDDHKADCRRHIAANRREQELREAISDYLISEIGAQYLQGELCVPALQIVAEQESDAAQTLVWGDFWVFWYNVCGDTLKTVSGGNHPGLMTLTDEAGELTVTNFEQVEDGSRNLPSAKRIFGDKFDLFQAIQSNADVREAVRQHQLRDFIRTNELEVNFYQDHGWAAVEL